MDRPACEASDQRAPLSLDGIELTRLERARSFSDRDAEWAALIADIDRAALKARIVIERKTSFASGPIDE